MTGRIFSYLHHNQKAGSLVQVLTETDFSLQTESLKGFGEIAAMLACGYHADTYDELVKKHPSIESARLDVEEDIGEKVTVNCIKLLSIN